MTAEVTLREVEAGDLPVLYEYQREPEANSMAAFPPRDRAAFDAHWRRILADRGNVTRAIVFEGRVAGSISSFEMEGEREVGYWIGREFWGKGIATRALAEFLRLETRRPLYAHTAKQNAASRRVLEKCGFVVTGEDSWTPPGANEPVDEVVLVLR